MSKETYNVKPAPNISFFTPEQPRIGAFVRYLDGSSRDARPPPALFSPLTVRSLTFPNRIGVSPMCTYSSDNYIPTLYHAIHYGAMAARGPGMIIVEAAAIDQPGAVSPNDLGIWTEKQAHAHYKQIVEFAHSQNCAIGLQLSHGGRKAGGAALYKHLERTLTKEEGGWPGNLVAPSPGAFRPGYAYSGRPHELTRSEIHDLVRKWGHAAKLAAEVARYDFVEIHAAHGYLISEFYSATSNKRKDEYGGSFENRTRFLLEIVDEVRRNIPEGMPLFMRISASENSDEPGAWSLEDSIRLSNEIAKRGVDVLDVSSGGISPNQKPKPPTTRPGLKHSAYTKALKDAHRDDGGMLIAASGGISTAAVSNELIETAEQDIVLVGKSFLKNPGLAWAWADDLGIQVEQEVQYAWGFHPNMQQMAEVYSADSSRT